MRLVRSARSAAPPAARDDARRLIEVLGVDPMLGLARVPRFVQRLEEQGCDPAERLAALEAIRLALVVAVESRVLELRNRPMPFEPDELATQRRLAAALEAARDGCRRVHADLLEPTPAAAEPVLGPTARLALARALDLQSRLLVAACRIRVALERGQWDELCRLAYPLWRGSALDHRDAEPAGNRAQADVWRDATPRIAFVLPLLLRLVEPLGLSSAELDLAAALARAAASRCGVRIDVDGLPHVCADGPALMLSPHHTVQLDTHHLIGWIDRCLARIGDGASPAELGVRTPLPSAALAQTLARVRDVWSPLYVPTPLVRAPATSALLHLGLPRAASGATPAGGAAMVPAVAAGRTPYAYPHPGPTRAAAPADAAQAHARDAAVTLLESHGEPVLWRGHDARRDVFARTQPTPRLRLGQLVAVLPRRATGRRTGAPPRPGSGPLQPRLGRVATLAQTGAADSRQPHGHDVGVSFWPGTPVPVRVWFGVDAQFELGWRLDAADGGPPSLVVRRDRFERPGPVLLRDGHGDRRWKVRGLIERGLDFDRVALAPAG
jgi:hypothetical protein